MIGTNPKIAIITSSINGHDKPLPIPKQTVSFDYYCYTEANLPFPLSGLSDRMKARYLKMQHHKFLPGYDVYIWIDGRIEVINERFVEDMVGRLQSCDMVMTKHDQRETTGQEYEFILRLMNEGNKYLLSRYERSAIEAEMKIVPQDLPLYATGVFARTNKVSPFMDQWWEFCIRYSAFDQCFFSVLARLLSVDSINYDMVKVNKHE